LFKDVPEFRGVPEPPPFWDDPRAAISVDERIKEQTEMIRIALFHERPPSLYQAAKVGHYGQGSPPATLNLEYQKL